MLVVDKVILTVLLGFLAAATRKIEFSTQVLILAQRQTALVAKQAACVDVLSGGRLRLGVGHPGHKDQVTDYVLKRASRENEAAIRRNVDDAADIIPMLADEGLNAAMKRLHTSE